MALPSDFERVLRLYPDDCQPISVEPLVGHDGFSGAKIWRLTTPRGPLGLRKWPHEHPSPPRLEFIQAVLWHVDQEGFHLVPVPLETHHRHGYVRHAGHLWELAPWLPGMANYRQNPSPARLQNAMIALAQFHQAARSFPLPDTGPSRSPGILERLERLQWLISSGALEIGQAVAAEPWPEAALRARRLLELFPLVAAEIAPELTLAATIEVHLQPCIRDIWHAHVLFVRDEVRGLIDFGSLRPENVAADIARLLGSLAGDESSDWQRGLRAYQSVRQLSEDELRLVSTFDRSTVLMGGIQWLEWIYVEHREFANRAAVLARLDEFIARLSHLTERPK